MNYAAGRKRCCPPEGNGRNVLIGAGQREVIQRRARVAAPPGLLQGADLRQAEVPRAQHLLPPAQQPPQRLSASVSARARGGPSGRGSPAQGAAAMPGRSHLVRGVLDEPWDEGAVLDERLPQREVQRQLLQARRIWRSVPAASPSGSAGQTGCSGRAWKVRGQAAGACLHSRTTLFSLFMGTKPSAKALRAPHA